MSPSTLITFAVFGTLTYFTVIGWTLAHCLSNCNTEDKTAHTVSIIFFPFGWAIYWLLKPYDISYPEQKAAPQSAAPNAPYRRPRRREIDYTEELLKPHTIAPCEQETINARNAAAAKAHALTAGIIKPTPAKPIHIIAQERTKTHPPFASS